MLQRTLCRWFFFLETDNIDFGSIGFYAPADLDDLSHFDFRENELTNVLSLFALPGSTDYPSLVRCNGEMLT